MEHFLLDVVDMQTGSLTEWVAINHNATHLLDIDTLTSYDKTQLFSAVWPPCKKPRLGAMPTLKQEPHEVAVSGSVAAAAAAAPIEVAVDVSPVNHTPEVPPLVLP